MKKLTARELSSSASEISMLVVLSEYYRNHTTREWTRNLTVPGNQPTSPTAEPSSPATAAGGLETTAVTPSASPAAAAYNSGCLHSAGTSQRCYTSCCERHMLCLLISLNHMPVQHFCCCGLLVCCWERERDHCTCPFIF